MTCILRILKKLAAPPTRLTCTLQLMLLTVRTTTSCPPPNINMHPGCAVFTCRLSHVILQERTLILLHCPSTVNSCTKSTSFHSILPVSAQTATVPPSEERVCFFLKKKKKCFEAGEGNGSGIEGNPYHNFPPRPPGDAL